MVFEVTVDGCTSIIEELVVLAVADVIMVEPGKIWMVDNAKNQVLDVQSYVVMHWVYMIYRDNSDAYNWRFWPIYKVLGHTIDTSDF